MSFSKQGKPAIVTIVHKIHVYILQVAQFLHAGECPLALKNFLADPKAQTIPGNIPQAPHAGFAVSLYQMMDKT